MDQMAEFQAKSTRVPLTDAEIRAATVGEAPRLDGRIELVDYDPDWPRQFQREADRIRTVLGDQALRIEHVGSTSVPGLCAKPRIDIVLVVPDSSDEPAYVPAMEQAGYRLRIREPDWFQHRVIKGPDTDTNIHVFSEGCSEIDRMTRFRDWLRHHPEDRDLYATEKRALAQREWKYVQNYADAKTAVIDQIIARGAPTKYKLTKNVARRV
jgi:GrpB-like predicted nucleotidyltransferase (UPF0157 family)